MRYSSKSVLNAFIFKFLEQFMTKGVTFVVGIILARMISPDKYGTLAILNAFIAFSNTIIHSGMNAALLQKKDVKEEDYSTVFQLTFILSMVIYCIIFFIAPVIEHFYESEGLGFALRIYAIILLIGSFNSIQVTKLVKEMRMNILMKCNTFAAIVSACVGIVSAYLGLGLWALVFQSIASVICSCFLIYIYSDWKPQFQFSKSRAKEFWKFGWKITLSGMINTIYNELRSLIVGKKYSTAELGFYNRGFQFPYFVASNINSTIQTIVLPVLSSKQDDLIVVKQYVKKAILYGSYFIIPLMTFLLISAEEIVLILLGEMWLPSVIYMKIFCVAYLFDSLRAINSEAIKALGESELYLKLEILRKIVLVVLLLVSLLLFDSPLAIAYSFTIGSIIETIILSLPCKNLFSYGYIEQIRDLFPIILSTLGSSILMNAIGCLNVSSITTVILQLLIGIPTYVLIAWFFKCNVLYDIYFLVKKK